LSWKVLSRFIVASFYTFCVALTVVGYQALLPVLVHEGVYASVCNATATQHAANPDTPVEACLEQKLSLDLMFTLATSTLNIIGLLVGIVMVRFGSTQTHTDPLEPRTRTPPAGSAPESAASSAA
jgi:hypothetical protein